MKTALLIIDVQNYYINEHTKNIPSEITQHIKQNNYNFILFSKFINHDNSNAAKAFNWKGNQFPPETDICDELKEYVKKDNVFKKDTYSVFKSKPFLEYIRENNISDITICGLDTDACVLASSYEGFDLGFRIKFLEKLTASSKGELYRGSGLNILKRRIQPRTK